MIKENNLYDCRKISTFMLHHGLVKTWNNIFLFLIIDYDAKKIFKCICPYLP